MCATVPPESGDVCENAGVHMYHHVMVRSASAVVAQEDCIEGNDTIYITTLDSSSERSC